MNMTCMDSTLTTPWPSINSTSYSRLVLFVLKKLSTHSRVHERVGYRLDNDQKLSSKWQWLRKQLKICIEKKSEVGNTKLVIIIIIIIIIIMSLTPVSSSDKDIEGVPSMQSSYSAEMKHGICMEDRSVHCECVGRNPRRHYAGYW